jgi:hypothetical protein
VYVTEEWKTSMVLPRFQKGILSRILCINFYFCRCVEIIIFCFSTMQNLLLKCIFDMPKVFYCISSIKVFGNNHMVHSYVVGDSEVDISCKISRHGLNISLLQVY